MGGNCGALPASFAKDVAAAEKARDASFDRALAGKKLTPWSGAVHVHTMGGEDDDLPPQNAANRADIEVIDVGSGEPYSPPRVEPD